MFERGAYRAAKDARGGNVNACTHQTGELFRKAEGHQELVACRAAWWEVDQNVDVARCVIVAAREGSEEARVRTPVRLNERDDRSTLASQDVPSNLALIRVHPVEYRSTT
jgi:hypothetical protein